ncbi:amine oxidase flavin-containing protein [Fusarium globosum]|uniref:Amine oxidase flavin-containing protein n=1 Tax=Fusarium globosum TaxID=78864 RepID=A0A8H5YQS3_9HYPO|nr:amine oxidase flavin-containing protein [Fusarium globosum]
MPRKRSSNGQNKRSHEGAENGQPASKSARTNDAPAAEQGESSQAPRGSRKRHIPRGPKGEAMMPRFMPRECAESKAIEAIPMPTRWIAAIDATPGREMTLGSRRW